MYTVIDSDGNEHGSLTGEQVAAWIAQKRLNTDTLAKLNDLGPWKRLCEFPGFPYFVASLPSVASKSVANHPGNDINMYTFIGLDGKEHGPVTGATIRDWFNQGRLNMGTMAKSDESGGWKRLLEFQEFFGPAAQPRPNMAPQAGWKKGSDPIGRSNMTMYTVKDYDGKEHGPVTAGQIKKWVAEGRLSLTSLASVDGTGMWRKLREFREFGNIVPPRQAFLMISFAVIAVVIMAMCNSSTTNPGANTAASSHFTQYTAEYDAQWWLQHHYLRDPDSYQKIRSEITGDPNNGYTLELWYRAKNGFGGYDEGHGYFKFDGKGNLISEIPQ
jgi:hypothetical protein